MFSEFKHLSKKSVLSTEIFFIELEFHCTSSRQVLQASIGLVLIKGGPNFAVSSIMVGPNKTNGLDNRMAGGPPLAWSECIRILSTAS